ncbi:hypothetical protein HPB51_012604 [Rhipicephalus microplus]|uniref:Carboxylesterase type B domain-containing protein n=1 Tax=Rhipicephalus microplus TaxID=6941 RepID=A0A9J6E1A2_RHIMP|nr:hypothetical protein HPB51_012604 [Rhipicephalus microplus]
MNHQGHQAPLLLEGTTKRSAFESRELAFAYHIVWVKSSTASGRLGAEEIESFPSRPAYAQWRLPRRISGPNLTECIWRIQVTKGTCYNILQKKFSCVTLTALQAWDGTLNASSRRTGCPQVRAPEGLLGGDIEYGEDCLHLNVWTAEGNRKRPVLVWIHGGGFNYGSGRVRQLHGRGDRRQNGTGGGLAKLPPWATGIPQCRHTRGAGQCGISRPEPCSQVSVVLTHRSCTQIRKEVEKKKLRLDGRPVGYSALDS